MKANRGIPYLVSIAKNFARVLLSSELASLSTKLNLLA